MNHLIPWITVIVNCILTGVVTWLVKRAIAAFDDAEKRARDAEQKRQKESEAIKAGMLGILKDRLFAECFKALEKGEISYEDRENIDGLYAPYKALGGNHTGDTLYNRVMDLKIT